MPSERLSRRTFAAATCGAMVGLLAGCTESGSDGALGGDGTTTATAADDATTDTSGGETADPSPTGSPDGPAPSADDLDLREANVVDVAVEGVDGGYRFDVTLHHDDDGEDGYANWWQVELRDGTRLGRRELRHPHSEQPFTRSETIDVPDGVACVVVRGHDQTHGYGGQAMLVTLETGATTAVDQGSDLRSFEPAGCP